MPPASSRLVLKVETLTQDAISPYGEIIESPELPYQRNLYTPWLGSQRASMTPRLHVNRLPSNHLPHVVTTLERHLWSAQIFLPLDVARFLVIVAPASHSPDPDLTAAHAFVAPGNVGILYRAGVWHAGATVLDRSGSFAVLMWRNDTADDEEFRKLSTPLEICGPETP